jgi:hypothetical protein
MQVAGLAALTPIGPQAQGRAELEDLAQVHSVPVGLDSRKYSAIGSLTLPTGYHAT